MFQSLPGLLPVLHLGKRFSIVSYECKSSVERTTYYTTLAPSEALP